MTALGPGADTLITNVRTELQETGTTSGSWDDGEIKRWLQQANDEVTRDYRLEVLAPQTFATVLGQESYALAADALDTRRVELQQDSTTWLQLQRATVDERMPQPATTISTGAGRPSKYYVWADNIFFIPAPDAVYTIQVWYYKKANTLALVTDVPVISSEFHYILELYAVARGKRKYDDPAFQTYLNDYEAERVLMKKKLRDRRTAGRFDRIIQTGA